MKKSLLLVIITLLPSLAMAQQTIRFATEATYAPFEYIDQNNQIQGFDIDIANALCKQINAECTFHNQAFDSLIPALKFKRYDAAISAMDITPARLQEVNFSQPYYQNSAVFVVLKKSAIKQLTALKGQRVGVQNGTTHQKYLLEQMPSVVAVPYASWQDAYIDLKNGRIDAVFGDTAVVAEWFKTDPSLSYLGKKITNPNYFGTGFGIATNKSNTALNKQLNAALKKIKANGEYQVIFSRYFAK